MTASGAATPGSSRIHLTNQPPSQLNKHRPEKFLLIRELVLINLVWANRYMNSANIIIIESVHHIFSIHTTSFESQCSIVFRGKHTPLPLHRPTSKPKFRSLISYATAKNGLNIRALTHILAYLCMHPWASYLHRWRWRDSSVRVLLCQKFFCYCCWYFLADVAEFMHMRRRKMFPKRFYLWW